MLALVSAAFAVPAFDTGTSGCDVPTLRAAVPSDGATDLPTDTEVVLFVPDERAASCAIGVTVADDHGATWLAEMEVAGAMIRVRPEELAPDRTYTVVVAFSGGWTLESRFSTTSAPVPAPTEADHDLGVEGVCFDTLWTMSAGWIVSDSPSNTVAALAIDGIEVAWGLATGERLEGTVVGARDACATLRLYDVSGDLAWESEPSCLDGFECPVPADVGVELADVQRSCDGTVAVVGLVFPTEPIGAGGSIFAELTTERETTRSGPLPWSPGGDLELSLSATGTVDACVSVTYVDVWGEVLWTTEPVCAAPGEPCSWSDDLDGVGDGCGCSTSRPLVRLFPLTVLLVAGHRRRTRGR